LKGEGRRQEGGGKEEKGEGTRTKMEGGGRREREEGGGRREEGGKELQGGIVISQFYLARPSTRSR
jgi:hypothetical protein